MEKVSVVVCTYNGEKFLEEQLDSILNQTYPIYEIIGQDDGSTDNTMAIWNEYCKKYSNVKVYQRTKHTCISDNFLEGIYRCVGDYIVWSDQDDIWERNKIEKQMEAVLEKDASVCSHLSPSFFGDLNKEEVVCDRRVRNNNLLRQAIISQTMGHTLLFKLSFFHEVMQKTKGVRKEFLSLMYLDALLGTISIARNSFVFLYEPYTWHRCWSNSTTNNEQLKSKRSERRISNVIRMFAVCLSPKKRKIAAEYYVKRFTAIKNVMKAMNIEEGALGYKSDYVQFLDRFIKKKRMSFSVFLSMLKCRHDIFYTEEKNEVVAILRCFLFVVTMYNYFDEKKFLSKGVYVV